MRDTRRKITHGAGAIGAAALLATTLAGCGGKSSPSSSAQTSGTGSVASAVTPTPTADPLSVPGIPDPCGLLPLDKVLSLAHITSSTAKALAVASATGGRSCAYNKDRPDELQISLTPVSKAGFDSYRALAQGKTTDLKGLGEEAYFSSDTPGVVDVFDKGFDLNVWVTHATDAGQSIADAKALATALAAKL